MTGVGDLVLIHYEEKPVSFARIENISPDVKKDWYHVELLLLQIPLQTVTWILRDAYINGVEYTMGGNRMRLEKVAPPKPAEGSEAEEGHLFEKKSGQAGGEDAEKDATGPKKPGKVISIFQQKKE